MTMHVMLKKVKLKCILTKKYFINLAYIKCATRRYRPPCCLCEACWACDESPRCLRAWRWGGSLAHPAPHQSAGPCTSRHWGKKQSVNGYCLSTKSIYNNDRRDI